ncbi:hypothetical protein AURDEDRAFT_159938 [Auricularia subglabra TFB-10046 SS5]|nr:hypothetical protein AURDEDRAFT_159938 [Auricularia subglabra TFB-10046 SS5]
MSSDVDQFVLDRALAPADVQAVLAFSSPTCSNDFHSAVHKRFSGAIQKIGLAASHTPFVNGLPFTLFKNGSVITDGAVGLALQGPKRLHSSFNLGGFRAISSPVKVTSARGNIVHTLGKDKATRHLLAAIHGAGLSTESSKDDDFYLALFPRGDSASTPTDTSSYDAVLQINSGDPSRGSIAVESEWGPSMGDYVQILHRSLSAEATTHLRDVRTENNSPLLRFSATTLEQLYEGRDRAPDELIDVSGIFEACSENGFVVYSGARLPWTCKFPGVTAALEF